MIQMTCSNMSEKQDILEALYRGDYCPNKHCTFNGTCKDCLSQQIKIEVDPNSFSKETKWEEVKDEQKRDL